MKRAIAALLTVAAAGTGAPALAGTRCATAEQARAVQAFYRENPATMPVIAARRLKLPETVVVSGLAAGQSAGTGAAAFSDIWAAMTRWQQAVFLIMKGDNVFEVLSGVAPATPSKTSKYTNIAYDQPLRGHLRPDQYDTIFAVAMPGKEGVVARGVLFYDADGASVFGAFMSGEAVLEPSEAEIKGFDELMAMIRTRAPACPGTGP